MSREESIYALRHFDDAVDLADDCAEANERKPLPVVIDPTKKPLTGG